MLSRGIFSLLSCISFSKSDLLLSMQVLNKKCEVILALDVESLEEGLEMLRSIGPKLKWVKVGLQLFAKYGPEAVRVIAGLGYNVFLDLKLHDIPNQVASSVKSLRGLPVALLTLHTSGGEEMMRWASEARKDMGDSLQLLGVTVLTSMDGAGLKSIGVNDTPEEQVLRLAELGVKSGIQGLVCSPLELPLLRKKLGPDPILVTPGIRPLGSDSNEQKRIMTPADAVVAGASYIVVGRPITKADNPAEALEAILEEMGAALAKNV